MNSERLDEARRHTLRQADTARKVFFWLFGLAAAWEAVTLITFVVLLDFSDRLHLLLFVQAMLVYGTLAWGLLVLAAWNWRGTLRVLSAVELLGETQGDLNDAG